jgi:HEPN domain-containing protein
VAADLLARRRLRHVLLFAKLSLEKLLKAAVARRLCDLPPRLHNLL